MDAYNRAFCESMAKHAKHDAGLCRNLLREARAEVAQLEAELRDIQNRCPHMNVVTQSSNSHELPDRSACSDCGKEW